MPFIPEGDRPSLDAGRRPVNVGEHCYLHYKAMLDEWRANRRWTTAHNIYKDRFVQKYWENSEDSQVAKTLAWQVFFQLHVMPYELEKQSENGDI